MIIAVGIVAYLIVWLVAARLFVQDELQRHGKDKLEGEDGIVIIVLMVWPVIIIGVLVYGIAKGVEKILTWDTRAWRARRSTRRIESQLAKENDDEDR